MDDTDLLHFVDGLYGYAMAITRNPTDAEDLVQETYLRAIPRMRSLRPESNLKSWLFTILRNIHLNQLRKQRVAPKVLEIDADENTANIVAETSKDPLARYVSKAERDCGPGSDPTTSLGVSPDRRTTGIRGFVLSGNCRYFGLPCRYSHVPPGKSPFQTADFALPEKERKGQTRWFL